MAKTLERVIRRPPAAMVLGACVIALTAPGLISWALTEGGTTPLASFLMRPQSALGLFGVGVALLCHAREGRRRQQMGNIAALSAAALGLATLGQAFLPGSAGVRAWLEPQFHAPGLIALALVVIGGSLALHPRSRLSAYFAVVGLAASGLLVLGSVYELERIYAAFDPGTSLDAEVTTLLAAFGALLRHQELGVVAALAARDEVGAALRRSLLAAAVIPSVFGQLALAGTRAGLYGDASGTALLAASSMTALVVVAFAANAGLRRAHRERIDADAALAASEERYRLIVDRASVGIAQVAADGRWLQVNGKLCEMLGYAPAELQAKTYAEVSHLEDLTLDVQNWELLRRGEIEDYAVERRFLDKRGEIVHADVRLVRQGGAEGEAVRFIAVVQDVTARKSFENTLRVYERAIASTQSGIVITDARLPDQPIVSVNPSFVRITGYAAADVIGKNSRFLNARARGQAGIGKLRRAIQEGVSCTVMLRNHRANGDGFWNMVSVAPVHDAAGRLTHFVGAMVDATEQVQLQAEREALLAVADAGRRAAEAANEAKDHFLSVLSHELRSPMNAVVAWASLLRDETDPAQHARALDAIDSAVRSQARLVDDLLDASRLRTGALGIEFAEIDLGAVIQAALGRQLQTAHEREVTLGLNLPAQLAICYADSQRVDQILNNLIDNALKFTPAGGRVNVELSEDHEHWAITVSDSGRGIPRDSLGQIFEEFWQADPRAGKGLGLGLAIVKHLVERQGGSVSADSAGPGLGSTFRVAFPKVMSTAKEAPARVFEAAPAALPNSLAGALVVVVDDDSPTAQAFASALAQAGAVPQIANSVSSALTLLAGSPDALISDIGLPDRDGFDLIRTVRSSAEPNRGVLAIAVTALSDREERKRIRRAGFDSYLAKPVEPQAVLRRLAELRERLAAEPPPTRRVLALDDERARAAGLLDALRADGHEVIEVADANAALREAAERHPDAILVVEPVREPSVVRLAERLTALKTRPAFVGLIESGAKPEESLADFVVPLLDLGALRRVLRLLEEADR